MSRNFSMTTNNVGFGISFSRFHELSEFDDSKRSCRRRLAGHNERRRKNASDQYQGEGFN